jgi:hypothetical protein
MLEELLYHKGLRHKTRGTRVPKTFFIELFITTYITELLNGEGNYTQKLNTYALDKQRVMG